MAHLRTYQIEIHSALSQRILNELAGAKLCLLNAEADTRYDAGLGRPPEASGVLVFAEPQPATTWVHPPEILDAPFDQPPLSLPAMGLPAQDYSVPLGLSLPDDPLSGLLLRAKPRFLKERGQRAACAGRCRGDALAVLAALNSSDPTHNLPLESPTDIALLRRHGAGRIAVGGEPIGGGATATPQRVRMRRSCARFAAAEQLAEAGIAAGRCR